MLEDGNGVSLWGLRADISIGDVDVRLWEFGRGTWDENFGGSIFSPWRWIGRDDRDSGEGGGSAIRKRRDVLDGEG